MRKKTYTLQHATQRCGYRRANTMREKHLNTEEARTRLGHGYFDGRVHLDADAVDELAEELEQERQVRGNWRAKNLGGWAKPRADRKPRKPKRNPDG